MEYFKAVPNLEEEVLLELLGFLTSQGPKEGEVGEEEGEEEVGVQSYRWDHLR